MSTIRERARKKVHDTVGHALVEDLLEQFGLAERELQKQEDADKARKWLNTPVLSRTDNMLVDSIISAGTEPQEQGPFGCGCGWSEVPKTGGWILRIDQTFSNHISTYCDHCPKCGKPRREK